ncbi:IQ calmodulin-binding motif domain-containing, putative [Babesia ovis]|uniref:IQ calmodulin-binding motif domain-containing, putative n=1 Tax=Babesia ovis TaxID=5869 RepID=A0A9W5WTZ5_BABOV|nr:IQ calmodulin-binding motif domain-containing, putative [Babesia ovis]
MGDDLQSDCCAKRSEFQGAMLEWYYKGKMGHTYGPIDSFRLVYFIYCNYFEENTPVAPSRHGRMMQSGFDELKKHLPLLQKDFNDYCEGIFSCSHYMDDLLGGLDTVDDSIECIPGSPKRSASWHSAIRNNMSNTLGPIDIPQKVMNISIGQPGSPIRCPIDSDVYPRESGGNVLGNLEDGQLTIGETQPITHISLGSNVYYDEDITNVETRAIREQMHSDVAIPIRLSTILNYGSGYMDPDVSAMEENKLNREYHTAISLNEDIVPRSPSSYRKPYTLSPMEVSDSEGNVEVDTHSAEAETTGTIRRVSYDDVNNPGDDVNQQHHWVGINDPHNQQVLPIYEKPNNVKLSKGFLRDDEICRGPPSPLDASIHPPQNRDIAGKHIVHNSAALIQPQSSLDEVIQPLEYANAPLSPIAIPPPKLYDWMETSKAHKQRVNESAIRWNSHDHFGIVSHSSSLSQLEKSHGLPTPMEGGDMILPDAANSRLVKRGQQLLSAHQMLIKQRLQSNLRETEAHLSRIPSRKLSHLLSRSHDDIFAGMSRKSE